MTNAAEDLSTGCTSEQGTCGRELHLLLHHLRQLELALVAGRVALARLLTGRKAAELKLQVAHQHVHVLLAAVQQSGGAVR